MMFLYFSRYANYGSNRSMATLKDVRLRIKSVKNIQKLTKSMKMVSAAKFTKSERSFQKILGYGPQIREYINSLLPEKDTQRRLLVGISSDRGLCGSCHSSVIKSICQDIEANQSTETAIINVGDKIFPALNRLHGSKIIMSVSGIGKTLPTFEMAGEIAEEILKLSDSFDQIRIFSNFPKTVISFAPVITNVFTTKGLLVQPKFNLYDDVDEDSASRHSSFIFACALYICMREGNVTELGTRMTAMDNASKNAGEMIHKLTLTFNRTRQMLITRELIEIISGATALEQTD